MFVEFGKRFAMRNKKKPKRGRVLSHWEGCGVAAVARKLTHVMKYSDAKTISCSRYFRLALLKAKTLAFKFV